MKYLIKQKDSSIKNWNQFKTPRGYVRFRLQNKNDNNLLSGVKRNDYIKLVGSSNQTLIRRVLGSGNLEKDCMVTDYDSILELGGKKDSHGNFSIEIQDIIILNRLIGPLRFYLFSTPDLGMRLGSWLGVVSIIISLISLLIAISVT